MSRYTKRAHLRLCPEKRRKNNLVHKGLTCENLMLSQPYTEMLCTVIIFSVRNEFLYLYMCFDIVHLNLNNWVDFEQSKKKNI